MNAKLRVGVISKTHGIRGEVKVFPTTDNPGRFDAIKKLNVNLSGKELGEFHIQWVKYFKDLVILKFKEINDVNEALKLKDAELFIPRKEGVALKKGEYYIADIIGIEVFDEKNKSIGVVSEVLKTGANDVYIVKKRDGGKDLLLPAIAECILDVNIEKNMMRVHLLDGLMDL